jgi:hypothetical protein
LVCVCVYSVFVLSCLGRGLATSWSPVQGILPSVKCLRNWEISPLPQSGSKRKEKNSVFSSYSSAIQQRIYGSFYDLTETGFTNHISV